ncbi:hypothetical protein [Burkholderia sp. S171]|uniref:hypothetical protein n=1 Tax=Burkholderia sp. S171 TaxID=1641860 RepID=UPI00131C3CFA|nr:hypothetical protein [Burkholderia sp. S171]
MATIDELLAWSQIVTPSQNFTNARALVAQTAVELVGNNWSAFRRTIILNPHLIARENILLRFLRMPLATLDDLVFVNTQLIDNRTEIPLNTGPLGGLKAAWPMVQIHHAHLRRFYASRGDSRLRDLVALVAPVANGIDIASTVQILSAIGAVVNAITLRNIGYQGSFDGIVRGRNGHTIAMICRLFALHPPGSDFPGFTVWGNGDHSSPSMNIRLHFMKHVLFIDSKGGLAENSAELLIAAAQRASVEIAHETFELLTEADHDGPASPDECGDWWRTLNILLPKAECASRIADHDKDKSKVLDLWCSGTSLLSGYIVNFVNCGVIQRNPQLLAWFLEHWQVAYRDYAIRCSRRLTDFVISSDGDSVFVAGTDSENFVIGRLDNDTGILGISSCYRPTVPADKMRSHHLQKLWTLN